jgi:hypothetical protein
VEQESSGAVEEGKKANMLGSRGDVPLHCGLLLNCSPAQFWAWRN